MDRMSGRLLAVVIAADAVWDLLLGLVLCLVPMLGARPWPVFVAVGVGCLAFSALLAGAVRGANKVGIARVAAIANAVATVIGVAALVFLREPLRPAGIVAVTVATVVCAVFAVLEWRATTEMAPIP